MWVTQNWSCIFSPTSLKYNLSTLWVWPTEIVYHSFFSSHGSILKATGIKFKGNIFLFSWENHLTSVCMSCSHHGDPNHGWVQRLAMQVSLGRSACSTWPMALEEKKRKVQLGQRHSATFLQHSCFRLPWCFIYALVYSQRGFTSAFCFAGNRLYFVVHNGLLQMSLINRKSWNASKINNLPT
jgi:hypothetical protein